MKFRTRVAILALGIVAAGVVVACTLNPQPLPPSDFGSERGSDASADGGALQNPTTGPADAAGGKADDDASPNDGDGGTDASDAGDAATDADAG